MVQTKALEFGKHGVEGLKKTKGGAREEGLGRAVVVERGERGYDRRSKIWVGCGAGRRKRKSSCFSEWILLVSSGECASIPQILRLKNAVTPSRSVHTHTHTTWPDGTQVLPLCPHYYAFDIGN